jgi:hypothetical protein
MCIIYYDYVYQYYFFPFFLLGYDYISYRTCQVDRFSSCMCMYACYNFWLMTYTVERQRQVARPTNIRCSV